MRLGLLCRGRSGKLLIFRLTPRRLRRLRLDTTRSSRISSSTVIKSGYLLDATNPNRLWFSEFCKRNRFNLNGLLNQSVEQLAA